MSFVEKMKMVAASPKTIFFPSLLVPFILASFVTAGAYQLFFHPLSQAVLRSGHGIQVYVLFVLVHLIIATTFLLDCFLRSTSGAAMKGGLLCLFAIAALFFYEKIGCHPPMAEYPRMLLKHPQAVLFIHSVSRLHDRGICPFSIRL